VGFCFLSPVVRTLSVIFSNYFVLRVKLSVCLKHRDMENAANLKILRRTFVPTRHALSMDLGFPRWGSSFRRVDIIAKIVY
jgi:hypothetical protein